VPTVESTTYQSSLQHFPKSSLLPLTASLLLFPSVLQMKDTIHINLKTITGHHYLHLNDNLPSKYGLKLNAGFSRKDDSYKIACATYVCKQRCQFYCTVVNELSTVQLFAHRTWQKQQRSRLTFANQKKVLCVKVMTYGRKK